MNNKILSIAIALLTGVLLLSGCKKEAPEVMATSVKITPESKSLKIGETFTFMATVLPESTSDKSVIWTSSDEAVAKIENGRVTALANGTTTITVKTTNGKTATATVTVTTDATGIELNETEKALKVGETFTFVATVIPEGTSDKTVTWTSSNEAVAKVEMGKVTALKEGRATVTAKTANGKQATATFTVKKPSPAIPDVPGEEL